MNQPAVVVDASVLVARFRPADSGHQTARRLMGELQRSGTRLCFPSIALTEVASAIARGTGRTDLGLRALNRLQSWTQKSVRSVDQRLAERSAVLAANQRVRGCDAIYLAMAQDEGLPLLTFDREQRNRAPEDVRTVALD